VKQAIVVRNDLNISTGKLVAQACHASVLGYNYEEQYGENLATGRETKVVLHADFETVEELAEQAKVKGLPAQKVRDAGRTEIEKGTLTALAVGPAPEDEVDSITGDLRLVDKNPNRTIVDCGGCGASYDTVEEAENCDCEDLDFNQTNEGDSAD
jgi:PTH2 family peptidyl-tRNA hydrolase